MMLPLTEFLVLFTIHYTVAMYYSQLTLGCMCRRATTVSCSLCGVQWTSGWDM